ncbi:hypothetical protein F5879DRAFT_984590 [Lentinula edodes]|uniref:uncharacterized protein n=1 Tax=Lentinula edodes TaxID=5353 RepID=UPI001E8DEB83|nr:uncharacterized protein C8R40DRAFT_1174584 [Lentinula edodes]KAH7871445.1 hypothetical protein C8R40DRAFT_1174584 [Lentinula edodes]KAJ3909581.1 hypothetical protein F5879DRAFT_984590 [Lentinula edodes]
MHLPIPCSSPVEIPSFLGFPTKYSYLSSTCSLFLLSFIGLAVLAAAVLFKFFLHRKSRTKLSTNIAQKSEKELIQAQRRTWSSLLTAWDGVTWPVSLTVPPPSTAVGRGVGLNGAVLGKQTSQPTRNAPSLNQTLPTIYQSKEPISMAKMIMSRHTFRRPSIPVQNPPHAVLRRPTPPSSPAPIPKSQSMV